MNAAETRCRPGLDEGRPGLDVDALRIRFAHPRVDVDDRLALAVDRDLDLLAAGGAAVELSGRDAVHHHPEDVLAVGREDVRDRGAAARAHRRALDVPQLRRSPRDRINLRRRGRRRIAERIAADLRRGPEVALEHGRRERLDVGDVVEAVADRVGRQQGADIDVDAEQIAHRVGVFGAIQPLERSAAGVRPQRGRAIEPILERGRERGEGLFIGTFRTGGRHHAGAQLADHLLDDIRMIGRCRGIERRQRQLPRLAALAVTGRAVPA